MRPNLYFHPLLVTLLLAGCSAGADQPVSDDEAEAHGITAGSLDDSFGTKGKIKTEALDWRDGDPRFNSVTFSSQNNLLAAGTVRTKTEGTRLVVAKFWTNGEASRVLKADVPGLLPDTPTAITETGSGRILLGSAGQDEAGHSGLYFSTLTSTLYPDTELYPDHHSKAFVPGVSDIVSITVGRDGSAFALAHAGKDIAVIHFTRDTALDTSFGEEGVAHFSSAGSVEPAALAIDTAGRIVLVANTSATQQIAVARLDASGKLDMSFGTNGWAIAGDGPEKAESVAVDANGMIFIGGIQKRIPSIGRWTRYLVYSLNDDGSRNAGFANDGRIDMNWSNGEASEASVRAIVIDPANRPILLATHDGLGRDNQDFGLIRLTPEGKLDRAFDKDGKISWGFHSNSDDPQGLRLTGDGRVISFGFSDDRAKVVAARTWL